MNNIPQDQNAKPRLELLAAQRQLYSDAKNLQLIGAIVSVPIVIVWSIVVALFSSLAVYAALWGIIVTFVELIVLSPLQKSTQEKAARTQQMFDCQVLKLKWETLNCGSRVDPETIFDACNRYKRKDINLTRLHDWYPVNVEHLPIHTARIICQRSNVWWDAQLRRRYCKWIITILVFLTIIVFLIGFIEGLTIQNFFLAVLFPLVPAFVLGLRQYTEHNQAAARLDRLRENAEILIQELISRRYNPQDLERESYSLQAQIYDNRRLSPLILDWFYSRLRNKDEEQMNKGAESLIQELTQNP